jgi:succinoglycan biosynthesis transport protein ExoP
MEHELNIRRYLDALRRGWWLILIIGATAAFVTLFLTPRAPTTFEASATVVFEQQTDAALRIPSTGAVVASRSLTTRTELIKSPQVLRRAAAKVYAQAQGGDSAELAIETQQLLQVVTARQLRDSDLVVITAKAPDPNLAVRRANAVADAYIEQTTEDQTNAISRSLDLVSRQLKALQQVQQEGLNIVPQQLAVLEDELTALEATLRSNRQQLEQLRLTENQSLSDTEIIEGLKEQLMSAASNVEQAAAQLRAVQTSVAPSDKDAIAKQIETSLHETAGSLHRGVSQLDKAIQRLDLSAVTPELVTATQIGDNVVAAIDSLGLAGTYLDELPSDAVKAASLTQAIEEKLIDTANSLDLTANNLNQIIQGSPLSASRSQLDVAKGRLASIREDLRKLIADVHAQGDQQLISDRMDVLSIALGVLNQELESLRSLEADPSTRGLLSMAVGLAQRGSRSLDGAIGQLQGLTATLGSSATLAQPQDIKGQMVKVSTKLGALHSKLGQLEDSSDAGLKRQLIDELQGLSDSLRLIASQIQALEAKEADPLAFGSLLLAKSYVEEGATALRETKTILEGLDETPSSASNPLTSVRESLATIASDLDSLSLVSGETPAAERVAELIASLRGVARQLQAQRDGETDPLAFGFLSVAEEQVQESIAELNSVAPQIDQLDASSPSSLEIELAGLRSQALGVASAVQAVIDELHGIQEKVVGGQQLDIAVLSSTRIQASSAEAILQTIIGRAKALRLEQPDVETYASILTSEDRLQGASSALAKTTKDITQLQTGGVGNQWLDVAVQQTAEAEAKLHEVADQLKLLNVGDSEASIDSGQLLQLGNELRAAAKSLEIASSQLGRAQGEETDAERFTQILVAQDRVQTSRTPLLSFAQQLEQFGQPAAGEDSLYTQLIQSQRQLQLSRLLSDTAAVRVADPAVTASQVADTKLRSNTLLGASAGLLLGVLAVLVYDFLDRRLRTLEDVKLYTGLPVLGAVPAAQGKWNPHPQILPDAPPSPFSESVRLVRASVEASREAKSAKVLLVTSPRASEGKTTVALNLARSVAIEKKVLLVDANLRKPEVGPAFKLEGRDGLATAIHNRQDPGRFITMVDGVHILVAGEATSNASDLLTSATLKALLTDARREYDFVIIDGPPVLGFAETLALAKSVDGVLLVARANRTTSEAVKQSSDLLEAAGAQIFGVVLNMATPKELGLLSSRRYGRKPLHS